MPTSDRPSFEEAKSAVAAPPESVPKDGEEVAFDKAAPKGPPESRPGHEVRRIPPWFAEVYGWIGGIVADESLILDLCLERAVNLVQFHHDRGLVGIDHFPEAGNGPAPTRLGIVSAAGPLAVELYKQVLQSINNHSKTFEEMVARAHALKLQMEQKAPSR